MNKFSSLSTSVLLALLTSSTAVADYVNGLENSSNRTSARSSDSGENNTYRFGTTDSTRNRGQDLEPDSLPSINGTSKNLMAEDIVFQADKGTYITSIAPTNNSNHDLYGQDAQSQRSTISSTYSNSQAYSKDRNQTQEQVPTQEQAPVVMQSSLPSQTTYQVQGPKQNNVKQGSGLITSKSLCLHDPLTLASVGNVGSVDMARGEHTINLHLSHDHYVKGQDDKSQNQNKLPILTDSQNPSLLANKLAPASQLANQQKEHTNEPQNLYVAFDYPQDLKESFMVAGDTSVISYSSDDSKFMITLKVTPLDENETLSYDDFKSRLLKRFSDKDNMLFGEYEIISEVKSTQDALNLINNGGKRSVFAFPIDPNDNYMELSFRAFLKKSADGVLPDMQTFFYERSIVSHDYIATLSCELLGRQSQASVVRQQFEALSPLFERILQSYQYSFN